MVGIHALISFGLYLLLTLLIGCLGYKATHDLSDYILGGRSLGSVVTALAAGASDMSGWLMMALPGAFFLIGLSAIWYAIGLVLGAWCNWCFVASRLRVLTEKFGNALTLPEYFNNRFADTSHLLRCVTTIAIIIFFSLYCASGMVAAARLFEDTLGISYTLALWIGAIATIAYVLLGGFLAVSWTDTVQASLMLAALIVTPLMVVYGNGGLWASIHALTHLGGQYYLNHTTLLGHFSGVQIVSLVAWGLGYFGQPHILVRFMAAESEATLPAARRISMTWMILCILGAAAIGFFGDAYFAMHPGLGARVFHNPETVFMELVRLLLNPWFTGIVLAGILSAIMSTVSAQLLVCVSSLIEDLYKPLIRQNASQAELVWVSRMIVLAIALVAIFLASDPNSSILTMVSYAWAGFGAAFGPVILLSLWWERMTRNGALAGIIVGGGSVLVWKHYAWFGLYELIPSFTFALLAIFVVSLLSHPPKGQHKISLMHLG